MQSKAKEYRGFIIERTGNAPWDYHVNIAGRDRWGTVEELHADVDAHLDGLGVPTAERGYA